MSFEPEAGPGPESNNQKTPSKPKAEPKAEPSSSKKK